MATQTMQACSALARGCLRGAHAPLVGTLLWSTSMGQHEMLPEALVLLQQGLILRDH